MLKKLNKSLLNLCIDLALLLLFLIITGTGILVKYVLVPGYLRNEMYGRRSDLLFWGMNRHEWGDVHLVLAFSFIILLLIHLLLHWKWLVCMYNKMFPRKLYRYLLTSFLLIITTFLCAGPFFIQPEIIDGAFSRHDQNGNFIRQGTAMKHSGTEEASGIQELDREYSPEPYDKHEKSRDKAVEVYGYMTLREVGMKYDISVRELAKAINVPVKYADYRLGRLRKQYGFHLDTLRRFIMNNN